MRKIVAGLFISDLHEIYGRRYAEGYQKFRHPT
jgi:hypothetical protein